MGTSFNEIALELAVHLEQSAGRQSKHDYNIAFELKKMVDDSVDAARYRELKSRYYGANFNIDDEGTAVIMFQLPDDAKISADLDATVDAIMN